MMKVIVSRPRWWRGNGSVGSVLLRPDGCMCIGGWIARAGGLRDEDIRGVARLRDLPPTVKYSRQFDGLAIELKRAIVNDAIPPFSDLIHANDVQGWMEGTREAEIIRLAGLANIQVSFED